jgi:predicted Rossmann fold nucleotide-binding protein DprA/Smf involved in DNA uptake
MNEFGNHSLLLLTKTAFLCSQKCPANIILKTYDWALKQREAGKCIMSGFHSKIEQDVFHFLIKGNQPIIVVLGRGLKQKYPTVFTEAIKQNRLLIVSPFDSNITRINKETSLKRNEFIFQSADAIFVAFAVSGGSLESLIINQKDKAKISTIECDENRHLIDIGVNSIKI